MSKAIRSAVIGLTVCFAMAASAQSSVNVGKDGSVKVQSGGNTVDVKGGKVNVQTQGTQVEAIADNDDDDDDTNDSDSDVEITGSAEKRTIACSGKTEVEISGSSNEITTTGDCESVEVTGSLNKVTVDGVGKISITGSSNTVTWKRPIGNAKKPKVSSTGFNNKVSKAK